MLTVVGATGKTGRRLSATLRGKGEAVLALDRDFEGAVPVELLGPRDCSMDLDAIRATGVDHCVLMYFPVTSAQALLEQLQWFEEAVLPLLDWRTARSGSPAPLGRERRRGAGS